MATVNDVYELACYDLLEDGGLQLGVLTFPEFADMLSLTITDFCLNVCGWLTIYTGTVQQGISQYAIPDALMRVDDCWLAGQYLEQTTMASLMRQMKRWRYETGNPLIWHADQLPPRTVEILPPPALNGTYIPGSNEPDPPHGQFGSFSVTDEYGNTLTPDQSQALSMIGPTLPGTVSTVGDTIPLIPTDFVLAGLGFGVLDRIFSADSEEKDLARAQFARQEYLEIVEILQMSLGEVPVGQQR